MKRLLLLLVLCLPAAARAQYPVILHSHNDYNRAAPFREAWEARCGSIEADVHLVDGEILVGHDRTDTSPARNLRDMYIDPIVTQFRANGGKMWPESDLPLQLMVDIKKRESLAGVVALAQAHPDVFRPGGVKLVITGDLPAPKTFADYPSFLWFDGDFNAEGVLPYTPEQLRKVAMISSNFRRFARTWDGRGPMPPKEWAAVKKAIAAAHAAGKPIRFWNAPENEYVYATFLSMGVDVVNTDRPAAAAAFFAGRSRESAPWTSLRPPVEERIFVSQAVEDKIRQVQGLLTNPRLAWMFGNCFPNTLDTTVHFDEDGPRTFVYTGDIHAMWLRDSGAQVWPYVQLAPADGHLRQMIAGVINCQFALICIDPYANAFNDGPAGTGWQDDLTDMDPNLHERKWEIDSPCYPIRLAYHYWKTTGDTSVFGETWLEAIRKILRTFREQQRKDGNGPYHFQRKTEAQLDTKANSGYGHPVRPVGLIASAFRPSDDATQFEFLVPSNFFAVSSLRKAAEILRKVCHERSLARECLALAGEVEAALKEYAVYDHPVYGPIYAYEVDGFGNRYLMDDANVPSLLAMAYLGDVHADDPVYRNTRRFVWSEDNPYYFRGTAAEGIGGPHVGPGMIWPMSLMMKAFTATEDAEIRWCLETLLRTDAGTGFIHESFHQDDPDHFTRPWFAWQNTLFGELILKLIADGKLSLLNSLDI